MESIRLYETEVCNKFSTLLGLEGCSEVVLTKSLDVEIELNGGLLVEWGCEGHHQFNANREAEQLGWNLVKYPSRIKGVGVEDENMERKHGAFLEQRSRTSTLVEARVGLCWVTREWVDEGELPKKRT
ncbi:hypothetical protein B296_00016257 [Ensete ventricosum]|uniref:Uncharacterized protein n=1 Tax=Ensete ventricosum TaxID=4639 RepID=A0A427AVS3_ENSVE|nr:hypothetical protein B296_00016257 [Ensete ventricosum]